jgi:hypothetical protein
MTRNLGLLLLTLASLLGLADAIFNYISTDNGIHGTEGALLVVVSTALLVVASLLLIGGIRGWLKGLFEVLIFLGILGTGAAAYFLEAQILLILMVIALLGWLLQLGRSRRIAAGGAAS